MVRMREVKQWWDKAEDDLEKAKILFKNKKYDGAVFYCQQSIEKGLIIKEKNSLRRIHDLVSLGKDVQLPQNLLGYCKEITLSYNLCKIPRCRRREEHKKYSKTFSKFNRGGISMDKKKTLIKDLSTFKKRVSQDYPLTKMIFFGSIALGKPNKYSDIDLVIVSPKFRKLDFFRRGAKMYDY